MAAFVGKYAKLYYSADGNSYTEVEEVQDATVNIEWSTAELDHRGTQDTLVEVVNRGTTLEFTLVRNTDDTEYTALRAAFMAKSVVFLDACTGGRETVGTEIVSAEWLVTGWSAGEPLGEFSTVNVTCRPAVRAANPGITLTTVSE